MTFIPFPWSKPRVYSSEVALVDIANDSYDRKAAEFHKLFTEFLHPKLKCFCSLSAFSQIVRKKIEKNLKSLTCFENISHRQYSHCWSFITSKLRRRLVFLPSSFEVVTVKLHLQRRIKNFKDQPEVTLTSTGSVKKLRSGPSYVPVGSFEMTTRSLTRKPSLVEPEAQTKGLYGSKLTEDTKF